MPMRTAPAGAESVWVSAFKLRSLMHAPFRLIDSRCSFPCAAGGKTAGLPQCHLPEGPAPWMARVHVPKAEEGASSVAWRAFSDARHPWHRHPSNCYPFSEPASLAAPVAAPRPWRVVPDGRRCWLADDSPAPNVGWKAAAKPGSVGAVRPWRVIADDCSAVLRQRRRMAAAG